MNKMRTMIALLCALNINANAQANDVTLGGDAAVGYRSDYIFRGETRAQKSLHLGVGASARVKDVTVFTDITTNQPDTGADFTLTTVGIGYEFADSLLAVYGGFLNQKDDLDGSELDVFITGQLNTDITLRGTLYRNTDDELYTFEASASKTFNIDQLGVGLNISLDGGTTEELGNTRTYYGGTASVTKQLGAMELEIGGTLIDTDESKSEEVFFAGLNYSF